MVLGCVTANKQALVANECISFAGHFDGHADALEQWQCTWQHLMQNDKCYTGSLWIYAIRRLLAPYCPGSHQGNNLQNDNEQVHTQFAGHLMAIAIAVRRYDTRCIAWWRMRSMAFYLKPPATTIGLAFTPITKIGHSETIFFCFFYPHIIEKRVWGERMPPTNNVSMKYQNDEKLFSKPILDT